MRRFHIALGVASVDGSVADYSRRLGGPPEVVVPGEYALWRAAALNFSIRRVAVAEAGQLRHLGWEDAECQAVTSEADANGIVWEHFSAALQAAEIDAEWPGQARSPG
jgi:hypothetical protein